MNIIFAMLFFSTSVFAGSGSTLNSPAVIQACLDQVTKSGTSNPTQPPQTYPYHQVDPSALPQNPSSCEETITTIQNVRLALQQQIAWCKNDLANLNAIKVCNLPEPSITLGCRQVTETDYCINTNTQMLALANSAKDFKTFMASARTAFDWYKDDGRTTNSGRYHIGDMRFTAYDVPAPLTAHSQPSTGAAGFPYPI